MEGLNKERPSAFSALFLHFHLLLKVNRNSLTLPPLGQDGPPLRIMEGLRRTNLIHSGMEQIEVQFFEEILVENGDV